MNSKSWLLLVSTVIDVASAIRLAWARNRQLKEKEGESPWDEIPYDFKIDWHIQTGEFAASRSHPTPVQILNTDKGVEIPPKVTDTHMGEL